MVSKKTQYYNGLPLIDYCKVHDLNINNIRNRMSKLKKRYPNKTRDEIITMAIEYQNLKNKYYYKNMLLVDYCNLYGFNYSTIRYRISSLSKKFPDKSMEEIIELAINLKEYYFYDDIPLKEYCELNDLKFSKINARIKNFKKRYPEKDIDEIVDMAINFKLWYFYEGIPLKEYCKLNNLNYSTVKSRIPKLSREFPEKTREEIIEMSINYQKSFNNYSYNNMRLSKYCELNNLNYRTISNRIKKLEEDYPEKSIDEIIDIAIHTQPWYFYKGTTLRKYCILNNINYSTIIARISNLSKEFPSKTEEEIVEMAITTPANYYLYDNMRLSKYCELNNLNYQTIRHRIPKLKEDYPEKSMEEIIDMAVQYKNNFNHYLYDNMCLSKYCRLNDLSYSTISKRIQRLQIIYPNKNIEEIIEIAINDTNTTIKYYYDDQPLSEYCFDNNINYSALYSKMLRQKNAGIEIELDKLVDEYNNRAIRTKIIGILNKESYYSKEELKEACLFLKISYDNVNEYIRNNFSIKDAINIVYFLGEENDSNEKFISEEKFSSIKNFCLTIDKNISDKQWLERNILLLYKLYKCNIYDSRIIFVSFFNNYMYGLIYRTFYRFKIKVREEKVNDIYGQLNLKLIELLNRCHTLNKLQLIKYITTSLKFYCMDYCYNNFLFKADSLDYQESGKRNKYNFIDANENDLNIEQEIETSINECFSMQLQNAINNLDKNSLIFIKLKYILQYDNLLIANHLNLSVDEVDEMEEQILDYLRNKPEVISLIYKK